MAEDAEKKNISRLDFNISDAINSLEKVDQKLKSISESSEAYAKKIGTNLGNAINSGNIVNTSNISKSLNEVSNLSKSKADQLSTQLTKIKAKEQAEINAIVEKGEQNRQTAAYKSALKQEEYNNRVENSTKSLYNRITEYARTYVIYQGFNQLRQVATELVEEMKNVEYRMMEISRIMEEGTIDVNEYRDSLIDLAYEYGRSFDDVSTVTLNFARAGYDAQDSLAMTRQSLLALNTAELDAEEATDGLISILAQWDMNTGTTAEKAENLANVIDKINKSADNFSIDSAGLLQALQRTSQGFNLAGASIDETIALIVAAETAAQRGGKTIGTAMSNIQQQLKAENRLNLAEELGLDFFTDEAQTQFKSITDIFAEMSERMTELEEAGKGSSAEMQSLLELFTVFRRNIGAGLLSEMSGEDSTYMKALETSMNSAGYSAQENSKYMETMEASIQKLKATVLDLESTLYDEGGKSIFTSFILGAEGGINAINSLIQTFGILPVTIGTVTLAFSLLSKSMSVDGIKKYIGQIKDLSNMIKLYNRTVVNGNMSTEKFNELYDEVLPASMKKYTTSLNGAEGSMGNYIRTTITARAKQLLLNAAIAAGTAALTFGLSVAIQAIIEGINKWINATDIAGEAVRDMNSGLDETVSNLSSYFSEVESIRKEMDSGNLTQEEYNAKKQDLLDIQEELIEKYGEEAKGLDLVTGEINKQKDAIEALAKANYKKYIQENQKEINKLIETFNKDISKNISGTVGTGDFKNFLQQEVESLGGSFTSNFLGRGQFGMGGEPEELLENYRELYNKIDEYRKTASGKDLEYANNWLEKVSNVISELDEKYSEDLETYKTYLNNKLQYDDDYSGVYGKILEARAKLTEAIGKGDQEEIDKAQENLNNVYKEAIDKAKDDPDVADGMQDILQEQIDNLNEMTEKEQIKLKIGVDSEEAHDSIQDILDDMGDISFEDLKEGLNAETLTDSMAKLKEKLDDNNVSIKDFIDNFDFLGFKIGDVSKEVESSADTLEYLSEQSQKSIEALANLDSGFSSVYNAMNEFNENGYITGATLQSLINNDLLQYFDVVNGKLAINEASMANAATAAKAKAIQDLQAKAAAEIAAIAFDTEAEAVGNAENTTGGMTQKANEVKNALMKMTPETLSAADAWVKLNAAMGGSMDGLAQDKVNEIQTVMNNLSKSITALNSVKIESVSYRRVSAKSSGGSSSSSRSDAERAAEEAAKAEEDAYKARLEQFTDYIDEKERLEQRWVDKQKELGLLSNEDYLYITQQRIERYKKYLEEVKNATWMNAEDRLELEKKYSEEIEDLQVDYIGYLKDKLDDEIDAIEKANEEKIKLIEEEADARIEALEKVEDETSRIRDEEDYKKERQSILDEIAYWEQRTGREAQENLKEAKEELKELDEEWARQLEDWSIEDQIAQIEEERDAQIASIEAQEKAEIEALQAIYDEKVRIFAETGQIIYENSVIQSQALYNAYKTNFIDPIASELANLNQAATAPAPAQQQYETYTIRSGDTLSAIAKRYGTTVDKIMAANPYIKNKNKIYTGNTLQIPKFHGGGIFGGNYEEGLALLKRGEVVLKPSWSASLDRMMRYFDNMYSNNQTSITNGPTINVDGDLIKIEANVKNQSDIDKLERRLERMLKDKFNIKK